MTEVEPFNDIMTVEDSNDRYSPVEVIEETSNDKPLMKLFKRLIGNDTKQNTVLTNAQIIDILQKEFNMDISYLHDLEIEIYLNLMKKFLKDWPQWDEFDRAIQSLKSKNDVVAIKKMLEINHEHLKEYLSTMVSAAKPFMEDVVNETKEATNSNSVQKIDNDIVLEINCTRSQLNQLFFRRPHPDFNDTIFNVQNVPAKIAVFSCSLRAMLNWPNIRINMNLGSVRFRRESVHLLKHRLVNKKLNLAKEDLAPLNCNLQMKKANTICYYTVKDLYNVLDNVYQICGLEMKAIVEAVSDIVKSDLKDSLGVPLPSTIRRTLNMYPYVRHLFADVETEQASSSNQFDLQVEETMVPKFLFNMVKFDGVSTHKFNGYWLIVDCQICKVSFNSYANLIMKLRQHFEDCHQGEQDWECSKCFKTFNMVALAESHWTHNCTVDNVTSSSK